MQTVKKRIKKCPTEDDDKNYINYDYVTMDIIIETIYCK